MIPEEKPNDSGSVTDFFKKHTRRSTPVFVSALVYVGGEALHSLSHSLEILSRSGTFNWYDWIHAVVEASIAALFALGAFMNDSYHQHREEKKNLTKPT